MMKQSDVEPQQENSASELEKVFLASDKANPPQSRNVVHVSSFKFSFLHKHV